MGSLYPDSRLYFGLFVFSLVVIATLSGTVFPRIRRLLRDNTQLREENKVLSFQKKSSEVRLGKIAENMAPFFDSWPYDPNGFRFLGNPVDGIQFTDDMVIFVEIKSGKARLSHSQKAIKSLVKAGKVKFATFRVDETGTLMKIEE